MHVRRQGLNVECVVPVLLCCNQSENTHNLGSKFNRAQYILKQGLWAADLVRSTDADVNIPK